MSMNATQEHLQLSRRIRLQRPLAFFFCADPVPVPENGIPLFSQAWWWRPGHLLILEPKSDHMPPTHVVTINKTLPAMEDLSIVEEQQIPFPILNPMHHPRCCEVDGIECFRLNPCQIW